MSTHAPIERAHKAAKRYIYAWGDGRAEGDGSMKALLGGKGAGLAEMTNAGLPTPPGFTITTEACNDYFAAGKKLPDGLWDDILEAVRDVERQTGKGFGDAKNPLLVSVRSGARAGFRSHEIREDAPPGATPGPERTKSASTLGGERRHGPAHC